MGDVATDRRRRFEAEAVAFMQPLYGTALRLTRSPADASDLVQEACLRAYRAFGQLLTRISADEFLYLQRFFGGAWRPASGG
ncbi:MAG: sigma factor [Nevskiaceae bacterium]